MQIDPWHKLAITAVISYALMFSVIVTNHYNNYTASGILMLCWGGVAWAVRDNKGGADGNKF